MIVVVVVRRVNELYCHYYYNNNDNNNNNNNNNNDNNNTQIYINSDHKAITQIPPMKTAEEKIKQNAAALKPSLTLTPMSLPAADSGGSTGKGIASGGHVGGQDNRDSDLRPKAASMWVWRVGAAEWGGTVHEQDMGGFRVVCGRGRVD